MAPRSAILLDETIHAFDAAICPVSVWYGGQCIVHLGNSEQTSDNEGTFWKLLRVVAELTQHAPSILAPLSTQRWLYI